MASETRIPLTEEMVNVLRKHMDRTGLGSHALLSGRRKEAPKGLRAYTIDNWLSGRVRTVDAEYYEYVAALWEATPDYRAPEPIFRVRRAPRKVGKAADLDYMSIDKRTLHLLRYYHELKFIPGALFQLCPDVPVDLKPNIISSWVSGVAKRARREHLDYVLKNCRMIETHPERPVVITEQLWELLSSLRDESGLGPKSLLAKAESIPDGLNAGLVAGWLSRTTKTARLDHWDFVLGQYRSSTRKPA